MKNLFTDHPGSVGENYLEHLIVAMGFSLELLVAAMACLVHALLPFLFVKTGSRRITGLYQRMLIHRDHRRCTSADNTDNRA